MLCREVRATRMVAQLLSMGVDKANEMSVEEACRMYERIRRGAQASGEPMSPVALSERARKQRRARITHPGKRFR